MQAPPPWKLEEAELAVLVEREPSFVDDESASEKWVGQLMLFH